MLLEPLELLVRAPAVPGAPGTGSWMECDVRCRIEATAQHCDLLSTAGTEAVLKYGRSWAWQALRCGIDRHYALLYADRHFGPCGETACELQCTHAIAVNSAGTRRYG